MSRRRRCLSESILNRCASTRFRGELLKKSCPRARAARERPGWIFPRVTPGAAASLFIFLFLSFLSSHGDVHLRARNEIFTVYYTELQNFYFTLKIRLLYYGTFRHGCESMKNVKRRIPKFRPLSF